MPEKLIVTPAPHFTTGESIPRIMFTVIAALVPATLAAVYIFGLKTLGLIVACIGAAVLTEVIFQRGRRKKITVADGSAILTGLLLALTLPPRFPYIGAILGSVAAIALGKQIFGGLGYNIFNPALIGRAFLQATFPVWITTWERPFTWLSPNAEAVSTATPLALMKFEAQVTSFSKLFWGNVGGSLGETSALALLLGSIYLVGKRYIEWRVPVSILGTVGIFGGIFWLINPEKYPDPIFHILAGGLILGAFFMATDPVTMPITARGFWVFGIGTGVLVVIIRLWGGLPEGIMYAILLMNAFTPIINRYTRPKAFGRERE